MRFLKRPRISRKDQKLEPQHEALLANGCERIFEQKIFSREAERGTLREASDYCHEGDVLVVARLDRLGRSLRELIDLVDELANRSVGFRSLNEHLDTTTADWRLISSTSSGRLRSSKGRSSVRGW